MSDRYGWHDDEFEVVKKGGRPSGGGPTPEVSGVNNDIEKAYHDPEPHDERDIEYREEQFRSFKQLGWTPEMITHNAERRELYRRWLEAGN